MSVDLLGEARRRLDAGDPSSARRLAERALESSRASGSPARTAAAAQLVAECLYVQGDIGAARPLADEALRLDEAIGDPVALATDLNLLGILELTTGRPQDAIALLRRSYDLRAEALGLDDPDTIESLNNLAVALWRAGEEDRAIELHEDALRRCDRALGDGHRTTADTLNALAVKLQTRRGSSARARELYERGLVVAEAALGPDSDLVGRLLTNVASARIEADELESAGPLLERALALHERHFGPASRWTAYVLVMQGEHAYAVGAYDDARRAFERAFVIRVNELGPAEPETLDAALGLLSSLGEIAGTPQRLDAPDPSVAPSVDEALEELMALYLPLTAFRPDLDSPLPSGARPDAERAAEQLRQIAQRIVRRTTADPEQTAALARAAELSEEADRSYLAGDLTSAADQLREAVSLIESGRGPTDTALVEPLQRLKLVHRMGGTESEVLPILRRIATILADAYSEVHPLAIAALGEIYWQERREYGPAGGRETAARIDALAREALGEKHPARRLLQRVVAEATNAAPPGTELEDPPLSVRRERILAEPDALVDELLPDLDATPWSSLDHAYGPAIDTPLHLRLLLADDDRVRDDALDLLGESLLHQGSTYMATEPALRLIRRLAGDDRVPGRARLISFLEAADSCA